MNVVDSACNVNPLHCIIDTDRDGFQNNLDSCPDPSESDGGRDAMNPDGCPDDDDDGDGVGDDLDRCLDQKEMAGGKDAAKQDGCPDDDR